MRDLTLITLEGLKVYHSGCFKIGDGHLWAKSDMQPTVNSMINGKWKGDLIGLLFLGMVKVLDNPIVSRIVKGQTISYYNGGGNEEYYLGHLCGLVNSDDMTLMAYLGSGVRERACKQRWNNGMLEAVKNGPDYKDTLRLVNLILRYDGNGSSILVGAER